MGESKRTAVNLMGLFFASMLLALWGMEGTALGSASHALRFDGVDDHVEIPALNLNSDTVTIEAWIKRDGDQAANAGIVFCRAGSTAAGVYIGAGQEIGYCWNGVCWDSGMAPENGKWAHVALVIEPTAGRMYLDGAEAGNSTAHGAEAFDGALNIGNDPGGAAFKGDVDEVRIWNVARTADEIQANKNATFVGHESLAAYYRFDEGSGNVLKDKSVHGHDGALIDMDTAGAWATAAWYFAGTSLEIPTLSKTPLSANDTGAMVTLEGIYNQLLTGTPAMRRSGVFAEPMGAPASYGVTIDQIMEIAPEADNINGVGPWDVREGKTYWGLRSDGGGWGMQVGTNRTFPECNGALSDGGRWCDNDNGTVTDMSTGLIWLKDASWGGQYPFWVDTPEGVRAFDRAAFLKAGELLSDGFGGTYPLSDGSEEGDWHLPTKAELVSLIQGPERILSGKSGAFVGVQSSNESSYYWSGTTYAYNGSYAWAVSFNNDSVDHSYKHYTLYVWPVRGGQ